MDYWRLASSVFALVAVFVGWWFAFRAGRERARLGEALIPARFFVLRAARRGDAEAVAVLGTVDRALERVYPGLLDVGRAFPLKAEERE